MIDQAEFSREEITFGQAEGVDPLPAQMEPRTMPQELRAALWHVVHAYMDDGIDRSDYREFITGEWRAVMFTWHVYVEHRYADEFNPDGDYQKNTAKAIISNGSYTKVFNFIEHIARKLDDPNEFIEWINRHLELTRSAYRIVEKSIVPFTTDAEAEVVRDAFRSLRHGKFHGAITHLTNAGQYLTAGRWADSIRESVHAVETVATVIEPAANMLGPALVKLERGGRLNPNLRRGFNALYDYTSDEKGIRHALLDGAQANVGEDEAIYMYGACSAFLTFLIRKFHVISDPG